MNSDRQLKSAINGLCFAVLFAAMAISGCSEPSYPSEYSNQVVVQGYLMAYQPIDSIVVRRTGRIDEYITGSSLAIRGARVIVSGNGIADTLKEMTGFPGYYTSVRTPQNIIQAKTTYTLYVRVPDGRIVTAQTTVPDTFHIIDKDKFPRVIHYRKGLYSIDWTSSNTYSDYITSVTSVDLSVENPIPNNFGDNETKPNRTSYGFNYVEKTHAEIPWFTFNYYGETALSVVAVDENYYSFIRQLEGGSTDIREIKYNVNGGLGVFGSGALDSLHVVLQP